jgi:hypothetical protein
MSGVTDTIRYIENNRYLKCRYDTIPIISISAIYRDIFDISTHLYSIRQHIKLAFRVLYTITSASVHTATFNHLESNKF